jgi:hypothetical protein
LIALVALILLAACGPSEGQVLLEGRCTECHRLAQITDQDLTNEEWEATVDRMILRGAELTEAERDVLVDYLARRY